MDINCALKHEVLSLYVVWCQLALMCDWGKSNRNLEMQPRNPIFEPIDATRDWINPTDKESKLVMEGLCWKRVRGDSFPKHTKSLVRKFESFESQI